MLVSLVVLFGPSAGGSGPSGSDKVVHLLLFAALAASARWRFGSVLPALLAVAAYAPVSELVQGLALPDRDGDVLDVVADLTGVTLGWLWGRRLRP